MKLNPVWVGMQATLLWALLTCLVQGGAVFVAIVGFACSAAALFTSLFDSLER